MREREGDAAAGWSLTLLPTPSHPHGAGDAPAATTAQRP